MLNTIESADLARVWASDPDELVSALLGSHLRKINDPERAAPGPAIPGRDADQLRRAGRGHRGSSARRAVGWHHPRPARGVDRCPGR